MGRGYNYATCVTTKIARTVGCQSFWTNLTGIPTCSDLQSYGKYMTEYERIAHLEKNQLLAETGCLRPCKYMEFSVIQSPRSFIFVLKSNGVSLLVLNGLFKIQVVPGFLQDAKFEI